ncbi:hypothetical protein TUBRATIS_28770 [Tubulinosema ratisbonensis]|uniref:Uncharacterized protein n=1 Tax=Tubulinosema ratisbonensis TaxID=291195 RepID=A0A437AHS0_9MICR|nr:hypothetical protein TUBRATIS_28770 [Tubulinosema ratisbonensis]
MLLLFFTSLIKAANKRMAKDYINQTNKTTNRTDQNSVQVCNNRKRKLKDSDFTDRSMISESKRIRCKKEINKSNLKNKKNATEQHEFNNIPLFVHEYTLEDSDEEYRPISSQQIHNKEELEVGSQPRKNNTNNSVNTNSSLDTKEKNKFSFLY